MEELIKTVSAKAGLTEEQAKSAINAIVGYLKEKLPPGVNEKIANFLEGKEDSGLAGMAKGLKDKLGL
ncbi:MAG: DUF2267 domain-containing protein [Bacteroidota bacterium]|nr:DUF2267 domain-containing protein [Bacteroidota bacterium]